MGWLSNTRKKRKKRNKRIQKYMEKSTSSFFSSILEKIGLDRILNKILIWSNNNRKKVFYITISFLSLVVIYSFYNAYRKKEQKFDFQKVDSIIDYKEQKGRKMNEKYRNIIKQLDEKAKIESIMYKDTLSKEDSIEINNMYNKIFSDEKVNQY